MGCGSVYEAKGGIDEGGVFLDVVRGQSEVREFFLITSAVLRGFFVPNTQRRALLCSCNRGQRIEPDFAGDPVPNPLRLLLTESAAYREQLIDRVYRCHRTSHPRVLDPPSCIPRTCGNQRGMVHMTLKKRR